MNGYCGDCDKQIEFHKGTIIQDVRVDGIVLIYLKCPLCDELELITKVDV